VPTRVAQEELEGVGRRLRREWERRRALVVDHLDALLLELAAESVELERFELALTKDLRECALPERARLLGGLEQLLPLPPDTACARADASRRIGSSANDTPLFGPEYGRNE
jgi:hypothetical protein